MSILLKALLIIGIIVLVLLCCPLSYRGEVTTKKATLSLTILFFIRFSKEILFGTPDEERIESKDTSVEDNPAMNEEAVIISEKQESEPAKKHPDGSKNNSKESELSKPSLFSQVKFAWQCGFLRKSFIISKRIIKHSWPGYLRVKGCFGTADPMMTGVIAGMAQAIIPQPTKDVVYCYTDSVNELEISCGGRIFPFAILWLLLVWGLSKETRAFWSFREGKNHG